MSEEEITWVDMEEEEDWEIPSLPDPDDLPDNTDSKWIFYRWRGEAPKHSWPLSVGITREICAPWRKGLGLSVTFSGKRMTFGIWFRGNPPSYMEEPPELRLRKVLRRARKYSSKNQS